MIELHCSESMMTVLMYDGGCFLFPPDHSVLLSELRYLAWAHIVSVRVTTEAPTYLVSWDCHGPVGCHQEAGSKTEGPGLGPSTESQKHLTTSVPGSLRVALQRQKML